MTNIVYRHVRVCGTTTPQLNDLAEWLLAQGVESMAMESTGVYWIPVYELLESRGIEVVLVNARELKSLPGRKTDMQDCQWIQRLHSCGLLRGSFRPSESICALRAIHRQWENLIAERTKAVQWMQKALDQMYVQVHRAVTDITGKTGQAIVRVIIAGERDPQTLAALRHGRCKKSVDEIAEHLTGTWRPEHLFNLEMAVSFYDSIQVMITTYEARLHTDPETLQPPIAPTKSRRRIPIQPRTKRCVRAVSKTPDARSGGSPACCAWPPCRSRAPRRLSAPTSVASHAGKTAPLPFLPPLASSPHTSTACSATVRTTWTSASKPTKPSSNTAAFDSSLRPRNHSDTHSFRYLRASKFQVRSGQAEAV